MLKILGVIGKVVEGWGGSGGKEGVALGDKEVCEMLETGLGMCCQMRLSGELRSISLPILRRVSLASSRSLELTLTLRSIPMRRTPPPNSRNDRSIDGSSRLQPSQNARPFVRSSSSSSFFRRPSHHHHHRVHRSHFGTLGSVLSIDDDAFGIGRDRSYRSHGSYSSSFGCFRAQDAYERGSSGVGWKRW